MRLLPLLAAAAIVLAGCGSGVSHPASTTLTTRTTGTPASVTVRVPPPGSASTAPACGAQPTATAVHYMGECVALSVLTSGSTGTDNVWEVKVGGVLIAESRIPGLTSFYAGGVFSFICPPGQKWLSNLGNSAQLLSSYLPL